jgi:hypothetical protein
MGIKELFEGIRNNLRRHDGSLEDRLNYYENKIGKGDTLGPEERREYLENKGIGSLDPQSLTLEEVTSSQGAKRSLLFQWTKSDFLKAYKSSRYGMNGGNNSDNIRYNHLQP